MSRRVIVVGGSSGIGAAIAQICRKNGERVVTMQRRVDESHASFYLDLRRHQATIRLAVEPALEKLGGLDWLVIAGGVGAYTQPRVHGDEVEEMIRTNYLGPRFVFDACLKALKREDGERSSRVLYVSSVITRNPTKALEDYAASKAAGETFFRAVGKRFAKWGIRSNVLATGWIATPLTLGIKPELTEKILRAVPLNRWGAKEEVARAAYLILDGPDFWTCDRIDFSGGIS